MSRYHDAAGFLAGSIPRHAIKRCSSASVRRASQKVANETCHRCRMLEVRRMTGAGDDMKPRTSEALRELLRVYRRHEPVVRTPDDERWRGDAMDSLLQALVRDRPDELARRAHCPHQAHAYGDRGVGRFRRPKHLLCRLDGGIAKDIVRHSRPSGYRAAVRRP